MTQAAWRLGGKGKTTWFLPIAGTPAEKEVHTPELRVEATRDQWGQGWSVKAGQQVLYTTSNVARAKQWSERFRDRGAEGVTSWR